MKKIILLATLLFSTASKASRFDTFVDSLTYRSDEPAAQFADNMTALAVGVAAAKSAEYRNVGLPITLSMLFLFSQRSLPRHLFYIAFGFVIESIRQRES